MYFKLRVYTLIRKLSIIVELCFRQIIASGRQSCSQSCSQSWVLCNQSGDGESAHNGIKLIVVFALHWNSIIITSLTIVSSTLPSLVSTRLMTSSSVEPLQPLQDSRHTILLWLQSWSNRTNSLSKINAINTQTYY